MRVIVILSEHLWNACLGACVTESDWDSYFFFNYSIRGLINQKSKKTASNQYLKMFYFCKGLNHSRTQKHGTKCQSNQIDCGLAQPLLLISRIIMNQSISDPSNLPKLLWRFVARCESYNYHRRCDADSSASRSSASGGVYQRALALHKGRRFRAPRSKMRN